MKTKLKFGVKITLMLKLQIIIDINLCKKVLRRLYVLKKYIPRGKRVGTFQNIWYCVKSQSQSLNVHSGCFPLLKGIYELA